MPNLHYGFLDESGILEVSPQKGRYFMLVIILVADSAKIKDVMKRARKEVPGKFRAKGVFKARHAHEAFVKAVLKELAKRKIEIIVGVWDKRKKGERLDKNTLYRRFLMQAVTLALKCYPRLSLVIHKRYTDAKLMNQIDNDLSKTIKAGQALFVDHKTEVVCKELELADAVAWACFQKYNRQDSQFYKLIREKIKI